MRNIRFDILAALVLAAAAWAAPAPAHAGEDGGDDPKVCVPPFDGPPFCPPPRSDSAAAVDATIRAEAPWTRLDYSAPQPATAKHGHPVNVDASATDRLTQS